MTNNTQMKPIGNIVVVGAVPGAMIITADNGEEMAISPTCAQDLVEKMQKLLPFSIPGIPVPDWPVKNGEGG